MNIPGIQAESSSQATGSGTTLTGGLSKYFVSAIGVNSISHAANHEPDSVELLICDLTTLCATVNGIKAKYNLHVADAVEHVHEDNINVVTAPDANDWISLGVLIDDIYTNYLNHLHDALLPAAWVFHSAQGTNFDLYHPVIPYTDIADMIYNVSDMLGQITKHDADAVAHNVAALHPFVLFGVTYAWGNVGMSWIIDETDSLNKINVTAVSIDYIKATFYYN